MKKNINFTTINELAFRKLAMKRASLTKKIITTILFVTVTIGTAAGGVYVQQEKEKKQQIIGKSISKDLLKTNEHYGNLYYIYETMIEKHKVFVKNDILKRR